MNHIEVATTYSKEIERDPDHLALLLFGSVANGTARPDSDLDCFLIHRSFKPRFKMEDATFKGICVGINHLDLKYFRRDIIEAPFNKLIFTRAIIMFDKTDGKIAAWIEALKRYFLNNQDIQEEWNRLDQVYREAKTNPLIKPRDIYEIFTEFRQRLRGRSY